LPKGSPARKQTRLSSAPQELKLNAASRDDTDEEVSAISKAKANLVSKISKKNLVENIVPVVISFKNILEKQRSPLLRPLLTYLREIMTDHKQEVQGITFACCRDLALFVRHPSLFHLVFSCVRHYGC
jgi:condensin-2 complex subunit D3